MNAPHGSISTDGARIAGIIEQREIEEVLHFTTSRGVLGILAQRELKARTHLGQDKYLEHVYQPNSTFRREAESYWRYVNLSITEVNQRFFSISRGWHASDPYLHWAVLAFNPTVLTHDGVLFAPGNMAYDGMTAAGGAEAFELQFAQQVPYGFGRVTRRSPSLLPAQCTDRQAEALYPDGVSTTFLETIYVATHDDAANIAGIVGTLDHDEVDIVVHPDMFG